jgi:hypothetical protein
MWDFICYRYLDSFEKQLYNIFSIFHSFYLIVRTGRSFFYQYNKPVDLNFFT